MEDDLWAFDIEPHTYTAVGSASGRPRKGFLARGGGGGVPDFMGVEKVGRVDTVTTNWRSLSPVSAAPTKKKEGTHRHQHAEVVVKFGS